MQKYSEGREVVGAKGREAGVKGKYVGVRGKVNGVVDPLSTPQAWIYGSQKVLIRQIFLKTVCTKVWKIHLVM